MKFYAIRRKFDKGWKKLWRRDIIGERLKRLKRVEYFHMGEESRKLGYFLENLFIRWAKKSFVLAAMPAHEERSLYQSSRNPDVVSIPILDERRSTRAGENVFWKLKQFHIVLTLRTVCYIRCWNNKYTN